MFGMGRFLHLSVLVGFIIDGSMLLTTEGPNFLVINLFHNLIEYKKGVDLLEWVQRAMKAKRNLEHLTDEDNLKDFRLLTWKREGSRETSLQTFSI